MNYFKVNFKMNLKLNFMFDLYLEEYNFKSGLFLKEF
jgi:hypothetical protein